MGAGGAGKALAYGGKEKGARVVVANRTYGEKNVVGLVWLLFLRMQSMICFVSFLSTINLSAKAKELVTKVGGEAITISELESFHTKGLVLVLHILKLP